ncbi:Crp/Fnr family transcriptional regulator [Streptomyces sp. B21-105]|uniref:Crp/Fnr family transcriptional regulator n=1 Tax=Streptomyces sp. B21-105 TaxID=3039417 RepID=UPI002FF1257C
MERNGDLSLLAFRGPGELDDGVRSANVESISSCVVGALGKADFLAFVDDHGLFPTLVRYALTRLRESDEARGGGDIHVRLAAALVYLIDISAQPPIALGAGGAVELALTRHELAQHLGVSRNTVTTALRALASRGVRAERRRIVLDDLRALRLTADGET